MGYILKSLLIVKLISCQYVYHREIDFCINTQCSDKQAVCGVNLNLDKQVKCLNIFEIYRNVTTIMNIKEHHHGSLQVCGVVQTLILNGHLGWINFHIMDTFKWQRDLEGKLLLILTEDKALNS